MNLTLIAAACRHIYQTWHWPTPYIVRSMPIHHTVAKALIHGRAES